MDYGKAAYAKAEEINKRLSSYMKKSDGIRYYTQIVKNKVLTSLDNRVDFFVACSCGGELNLSLTALVSAAVDFNCVGALQVNGLPCAELSICGAASAVSTVFAAHNVEVEAGLNRISLAIEVAAELTVNCATLTVGGIGVTPQPSSKQLTACAFDSQTYCGVKSGNTFTLYTSSTLTNGIDYTLPEGADKLKLCYAHSQPRLLYSANGGLYIASFTDDSLSEGVLLCKNVAQYDVVAFENGYYLFTLAAAELYVAAMASDLQLSAQCKLPISGRKSFFAVDATAQGVTLAAVTKDKCRIYRTADLESPFTLVGTVDFNNLCDLRGDTLLSASKGIVSKYSFLTDTAVSLCYADAVALVDQNRMLVLNDGQLSVKEI